MWYMGGGPSSQETPAMVSSWNPRTESWYTNMAYENSSTIAEALTSCYSLLEGSWSTRSEGYKFLSEPKLTLSVIGGGYNGPP